RVFDLVRHLARQGLPACQLAQVDEALRTFLEAGRHVVEGPDGAPDFIVAPRLHARVEIAPCQFAQPAGQLLDGPADTVSQVDQQGERHQPDARSQHDVSELDAAAQIARVGLFHGAPRLADFTRQAIHRHVTQALRVDPDFVAVAYQIVQTVAVLAG